MLHRIHRCLCLHIHLRVDLSRDRPEGDLRTALPPGLMRPAEEFMKHFFHWLVLGQLVFVFFFTMIFASFAGGGGAGAGARYGILVALLGFGANLIQFAVHPLTTRVLGFWGIGGLIELAIAGAIIGAIYKPSSHTTT